MLTWGWRRAAVAFGAGALSVLALPPFDLWPIAFFTFPLLVWLVDGVGRGRLGGVLAAAGIGWWFGFGYFTAGLYWIGHAFLVDAKTFGWLLPVAVTAFPAGLALFTALGVALARLLWTAGPFRILVLAAALTFSEWLRGWILSGFPWNAFGYALSGPLVFVQGASLFGLWGLTLLAVAVFASPATLTDERARSSKPWLPIACSIAMLVILAGFGALRLRASPTTFVEGVRVRIMQPNLSQDQKFNYAARNDVMRRYTALSDRATGPERAGLRDITHLIWPESAFPFFLAREPGALAQIAALLPPGVTLITGAARVDPLSVPGRARAYNSVYVIDDEGGIQSVYDKMHLVPFGEFLPFQDVLERIGLQQLTKMQGGFIPGTARRPMSVPNAPSFAPLVCYEIIFPGRIVEEGQRPGWLLNVTNDGWFGISTGPYQHLRQAQVRAVEEGLPVVRAANTGISAVIDPWGRILAAAPLGHETVLDASLPGATLPPLFTQLRNTFALMLVGSILLLAFGLRALRRSRGA